MVTTQMHRVLTSKSQNHMAIKFCKSPYIPDEQTQPRKANHVCGRGRTREAYTTRLLIGLDNISVLFNWLHDIRFFIYIIIYIIHVVRIMGRTRPRLSLNQIIYMYIHIYIKFKEKKIDTVYFRFLGLFLGNNMKNFPPP